MPTPVPSYVGSVSNVARSLRHAAGALYDLGHLAEAIELEGMAKRLDALADREDTVKIFLPPKEFE